MIKRLTICIILIIIGQNVTGRQTDIKINIIKKEATVLPGDIVNLPYFIKNESGDPVTVKTKIEAPEQWKVILKSASGVLSPNQQVFSVLTIQIPDNYEIGEKTIDLAIFQNDTVTARGSVRIWVEETERISLKLAEIPQYLTAGDTLKANYLLQNLGNTTKNVFIETRNCDVAGNSEIKLPPGESTSFMVYSITSSEITEAAKEFITVRAVIGEKIMQSNYNSIVVFPSGNTKKDLYHRLPVSFSSTYVSTNQQNGFRSAYQFELFGSGTLDPDGNHKLEFLARGPDNSNLSFLGMYDQYYISYSNNNMELFAGEKSFRFTPLTESSRFGMGTENKFRLNNGLFIGFAYLEPRYYEEISKEYAVYSGFERDRNNLITLYYIQKKNRLNREPTHLSSINSKFQPLKKTTVELEFSHGKTGEEADIAYRTNINTQFSIFNLAGNYFLSGKDYPGYFTNSTFYSGNISAEITSDLSLGVNAREDFINAQLDTFFLYAPYSKSYQAILNYKFASRSYLKIYWREYERKDRLALNKFHYKTRSANAQLNQKIKKLNYRVHGELGNTTNLLLPQGENKQTTFRASINTVYRFNSKHSMRLFGSWSNINSFVSGEQRNITAGMSASSQIGQNLAANFHIQNAYNIDDYYRNRNLMQLNLDYTFLKNHQFIFHSFYTIFRRQTENPELTFSVSYKYNFSLPVKQLMKAGDVKGRITDEHGTSVEGIIVHLLNKSSVTDKNGEFWLKSIQPGKHLLTVDRANLKIDEVVNIPTPIEIDVIEDRETFINFKITKGAKIDGFIAFPQDQSTAMSDETTSTGNIIVELTGEKEQFRITTNSNGQFSFPLVRPGKWVFKIYPNSVPKGFELEQNMYNLELESGEKQNLKITLKKKKRNIIFKSQNIILSTSEDKATEQEKLSDKPEKSIESTSSSIYYSIQIGAFRNKKYPESEFFKGYSFDYEIQNGDFYKYLIGKFERLEEAEKEREKLLQYFWGAFIVGIKNGEIIYDYK